MPRYQITIMAAGEGQSDTTFEMELTLNERLTVDRLSAAAEKAADDSPRLYIDEMEKPA